jgi:hypothetical protein
MDYVFSVFRREHVVTYRQMGSSMRTHSRLMPILINTKKCTSAQICTAFESYLAIFGQIARKCCANAGHWTPDTILAYINRCYHFALHIPGRCSFSNFLSQLFRFFCFLKKIFYGSSFTMSASTANIANKKAATLPTSLDDASISDVVLEQVFEKGRHQFDDEDLCCFKRTS